MTRFVSCLHSSNRFSMQGHIQNFLCRGSLHTPRVTQQIIFPSPLTHYSENANKNGGAGLVIKAGQRTMPGQNWDLLSQIFALLFILTSNTDQETRYYQAKTSFAGYDLWLTGSYFMPWSGLPSRGEGVTDTLNLLDIHLTCCSRPNTPMLYIFTPIQNLFYLNLVVSRKSGPPSLFL